MLDLVHSFREVITAFLFTCMRILFLRDVLSWVKSVLWEGFVGGFVCFFG